MIFAANRVARAHALESHRGANIAGKNLADLFALIGVHLQQTADAFASSAARVQHGVSGLKLAGIHANKRQLADKRIGHNLERQR